MQYIMYDNAALLQLHVILANGADSGSKFQIVHISTAVMEEIVTYLYSGISESWLLLEGNISVSK